MKTMMRAGLAALALGSAAAPALAQDFGPPPGGPPVAGPMGGKGMRGLFENMSPEGRSIMWEAMKSARDDGTRAGIKAARDKTLDLLNAEKLDVAAIRRTMLEERNLAQGQHQRMQEAMLGAFQKLSLADRRAFVASAREAKSWMEQRRELRRQGQQPGR